MRLSTALQSNPECQDKLNELIEFYSLSIDNLHLEGRIVTTGDHATIAGLGAELILSAHEIVSEAIAEAEAEQECAFESQQAQAIMREEEADREID